MQPTFVPPRLGLPGYDCPHCFKFALFTEFDVFYKVPSTLKNSEHYDRLEQHINGAPSSFAASRCQHCGGVLIWNGDRLSYPMREASYSLYSSLPGDLQPGFQQALKVLDVAPAASAALLRGILQRICYAMGKQPNDSETYVSFLSRSSLSPSQQAILNVTCKRGARPVPPGVIDDLDDAVSAHALTQLIVELARERLQRP